MARIKKKGLDYFPMDVEFVGSRPVRRLIKREGESAYMVLSFLISDLYGGEGYYLSVDEDYYEDLADRLFTMETDDVRRIVKSTIELGIFDAVMFATHGILTSAEIQRQYLFVTKRRSDSFIDEKYNLLTEESVSVADVNPVENVAETGINVTETAEKCTSSVPGYTKHSIAKHSIAKHTSSSTGSSKPVKEWTKEEAVCHHQQDRLRPDRPSRMEGICGASQQVRQVPFARSLPAETMHLMDLPVSRE